MDLGTVFNLRELGFNLSGKASSGKLGPTGERHANTSELNMIAVVLNAWHGQRRFGMLPTDPNLR